MLGMKREHRHRSLGQRARQFLPWVLAAVVVGLLVNRYSISKILGYIQSGDAWLLVPLAMFSTVATLALMVTADWLIFRASVGTLRWRTVLRGRGGMSLISAVSYGAGQGSYGVWVARVSGSSLAQATGIIAYLMLCDLTSVCLVASSALWMSDLPIAQQLRWLALGLAPLVALGLISVALLGPTLLPRLQKHLPFLQHIAGLTRPWSSVGAPTYLLSLLIRVFSVLTSTILWYLAAQALGLDAPLAAFLTYIPMIYLVGSMPVNVGPFGVVQVAWLHFFSPYAPEEQVIALQVAFGALLIIGFALRGLPFVARVVREISEGTKAEELSEAQSDSKKASA